MRNEGFYLLSKLVVFFCAAVIGFSGCAAQKSDEGYYDRANKASQEALDKLDKE